MEERKGNGRREAGAEVGQRSFISANENPGSTTTSLSLPGNLR
jgi:hypothetical protein